MSGLLSLGMLVERRKVPRKALRAPARMRNGFLAAAVRCEVLDVSPNGACVNADNVATPNSFTLVLDAHGTTTRLCSVVWRNAFTVGVKFMPRLQVV
jgi:hypothetical protein